MSWLFPPWFSTLTTDDRNRIKLPFDKRYRRTGKHHDWNVIESSGYFIYHAFLRNCQANTNIEAANLDPSSVFEAC